MKEPTEVELLQNEVFVLRQQLAEAKALAWKWEKQLRVSVSPVAAWGSPEAQRREAELSYWVSKCHRQRTAINMIQRKGWFPPEYVIHEEDIWAPLAEAT